MTTLAEIQAAVARVVIQVEVLVATRVEELEVEMVMAVMTWHKEMSKNREVSYDNACYATKIYGLKK